MDLGAPVEHLLIDLDGTLLGNRAFPLHLDFVTQALSKLRTYGGLKKRVQALMAVRSALGAKSKAATNDVRAVQRFSKIMELTPEEGRKVLRESIAVLFPTLERHFFPMPGAKDFLAWAQGKFELTLATNPVWPIEIVALRLKWAGVDQGIFKSITTANRMHACKPEPEYYEEILEQGGLKADRCLLVGDDLKMDLPATRVGIRVFIVDKDKRSPTRVENLELSGARASAWKGSFGLLQTSLDGQLRARIGG